LILFCLEADENSTLISLAKQKTGYFMLLQGVSDPIPPVSNWVPALAANGNYFGLYLPKGTPSNAIRALQKIWDELIPTYPAVKDYALRTGATFSPVTGAAAQAEVLNYLSAAACCLYDAKQLVRSP
jgi:hypothetical protein